MSDNPFPNPPNRLMTTLYRAGLGRLIGRLILLLTTTGRKTGLARVTPLQYEEVDGAICVGSARGQRADWYRNILANPRVQVQVGGRRFAGTAEPVADPVRIADFLELRLRRHPSIVGRILESQGLPRHPDRAQLEAYAGGLALVVIRRVEAR